MNIAVCINHVPDTASKINLTADSRAIDTSGLTYIINPYDEFALEEALRTKEKVGGIIYVISAGPSSHTESIRKALALGIDEGIHLKYDGILDSVSTAKILADRIRLLNCELVFMGKQSIDYNNGIVGQLTAELLGYHCVTVCTKFNVEGNTITAEREIEGGKEIVSAALPCVITAQKGLNEPRYASLKGIMAAKKKTISEIPIDPAALTTTFVQLNKPIQKSAGRILGSDASVVPELVRLLHEEAKVI
jgi:electron transfer flavoprotein beta subunit